MRIVGGRSYLFEYGVAIYLRAAGFLCEPAEERITLAGRLRGQIQLFAIGLVGRFGFAGTKIPCDLVFCRSKLRIECPRGRNRDRVVQCAVCLFGVPAGECVTCLDRRVAGGNGSLVGRDGGRHAVLAADCAAVAACIPCDSQRDGCAAVIALAVAVRVHMIGVFFATCLADGTSFRALVLGIAYA